MKTVALLCTLMLFGATMSVRSDEAPRDPRDDAFIILAIDYTKDQATGSWVTCVTCSVRQSTNAADAVELTGKAWIELIDTPAPGVSPGVRARREAIPTVDPTTGRLHFYGFFPGRHGPHNGLLPNLILELKPKGTATEPAQHMRRSLFRKLSDEEKTEELKIINVPESVPDPRVQPEKPVDPERPKPKPRGSPPRQQSFAIDNIA